MDAKRREELRKQFDGVGGFVSDVCRHGGPTVDELRALLARDEALERIRNLPEWWERHNLTPEQKRMVWELREALGRD